MTDIQQLEYGNFHRKVVFVIDRVMHYHRATLAELERQLGLAGFQLVVLSSTDKTNASGRVADPRPAVSRQHYYHLIERQVGRFTIRYQRGMLQTIRSIRPSVVISTSHPGTISEWGLIKLKRQLGFKLIAWQCGYEYNPGALKNTVLGFFVPRFDHHLAYHTNAKQYALSHGALPAQVTVMHNTINEGSIVRIPKGEARSVLEARFSQLQGKKIVLYVGAVLEEKRLELVFDALSIMNRSDAVFVVVGDGPYLKTLQDRFEARSDALFVGRVIDGVGIYFDAAEVFVLPGTGGLAINEAMAHAVPVISGYADGSADDLVLHGETGFLLRKGSAEELAERLGTILDDGIRAVEMGLEGESRIRGTLSFRGFIDRIVSVITTEKQ
jgi:glycosyltransferase involved in cell wall biosynthesis